MTIEIIIAVIAMFVTLGTAILTAWAIVDKSKKSFTDIARTEIKDALDKNNDIIEERRKADLKLLEQHLCNMIDNHVSKDLEHVDKQHEINEKDSQAISLLRESLLESYKREIRGIYYKLRETGDISDVDKSYLDKIYPKYIALGGNSDITAKYEAICEVYDKHLRENFEKAREKKRKEKEKQLNKNNETAIGE